MSTDVVAKCAQLTFLRYLKHSRGWEWLSEVAVLSYSSSQPKILTGIFASIIARAWTLVTLSALTECPAPPRLCCPLTIMVVLLLLTLVETDEVTWDQLRSPYAAVWRI